MQDQDFWKHRVAESAVLEPVDRISEVIFGLIMVLTFTGGISVSNDGRQEVNELLWAALSCNVAWGLVDAIMYVMNVLFERGHSLKLIRKFKQTDKETAREILKGGIQPLVSALMKDEELDQLGERIKQLSEPPKRVLFSGKDLLVGFQIFFLVFLCTFPVAIPFLLIEDVGTALRTSNGVTLLMLFVGGYKLAEYAGFRPIPSALIYTLIGFILIVFTIALGG